MRNIKSISNVAFEDRQDLEEYYLDQKLVDLASTLKGVKPEVYRSRNSGKIAEKQIISGRYFIFNDQTAYLQYLGWLKGSNTDSRLHQLIFDYKLFLQERQKYVERLAILLDVDRSKLDYSRHSVDLIDQALSNSSFDKDENFRLLYLCLLRYLGEIYYSERGLSWQFDFNPAEQTYWPSDGESDYASSLNWANILLEYLSPDPIVKDLKHFIYNR